MDKDNKNTELNDTDKKLHISDVSESVKITDEIEKVDISQILVNNKYRLPVTEFDTAVYVVDIPKASQLILDLISAKKLLQHL